MTQSLKRYAKLGLVQTINGQRMWHGAMFLYMAADEAYAPGPAGDTGKQKDARVVSEILAAARNAGYAHTYDLQKRLADGMRGQTTANMAMQAVDAIGGEAGFMRVLDRAGFNMAHQMPAHTGSLQ